MPTQKKGRMTDIIGKCTCKNERSGYCSLCNGIKLPEECTSKLATRPILYTDTVHGEQTHRDDLWAVTTRELNELENSIQKARDEERERIHKLLAKKSSS